MDELARSISAAAGLDPDTARKAAGIVLDFIQKSVGPSDSAAVIDAIAGGREAAAAAAEDEAEGGGTSSPDLYGLASRLMAEGVPSSDLERFGRAVFASLRAQAGEAAVTKIAGEMPDLAPFM